MSKWDELKQYLFGDGEKAGHLNQFMKKKQNIIGAVVLVVFLIVSVMLYRVTTHTTKPHSTAHSTKTTAVDGVLSTDFTQKNELSALEQQQIEMDRLQNELKTLKKQIKTGAHTSARQSKLIAEMKAILAKRQAQQQKLKPTPKRSLARTTQPYSRVDAQHKVLHSEARAHAFDTLRFDYPTPTVHPTRDARLADHRPRHVNRRHRKTSKNYVPAGTFANVVLLEGADANASVNGQADTVGILMRILDNGTLPNGHHSLLKGCFVLASIYGDISSERGEARLTTLSCTRQNGTVLEKKVQGYLSFAGKEGVKGHPVMRNGKILAMAGMSGLFSGLGSSLQQSTQTQSISPLGTTSTIDPSQVLQSGLYGGVNTAMNRLANYYIKRADQYHPIIEIGSGTVATVIFQKGFSLLDDQDNMRVASNGNDSASHSSVAMNQDRQTIQMLLKEAQQQRQRDTAQHAAPFSNVSEPHS